MKKEPPLQNIPVRSDLGKEIRRAFRVLPAALMSCDYSALEIKLAAIYADKLKAKR